MDMALAWGILIVGFVWFIFQQLYPYLLQFLQSRGMVRENYQGMAIPIAVGLFIPLAQVVALPFLVLYEQIRSIYLFQVVVLVGIAFLGWRDDLFGGNEAKGIRGHFLLWRRTGAVSTGLQKAIGTCILSFLICAMYSTSLLAFFIDFFLILFATNLLNLLDLRPGRAIKSFLLLLIPLFAFSVIIYSPLLWLPPLTAAFFLLRFDLQGRAMLGDTGSNSLGMLIGFWTVLFASLEYKLIFLIISVLIHLYAEKKSITVLIQNTAFLRWLDTLGRKKA
ncbi:hypothetical protein [Ammoniphilus resinae]|uniref:UDP-N-acetylmuramyl pentapeptide phosphotransferase/UDP-N-acetylglucosamine-1-phosphate transferase n=1 Tax=Ammoniphilus resinae TaxID=861532 RepID=A0ABS4GTE5_9BACL|nr:hypothetical protein [Ammoniphilus resinae]MBP1933553.1 UDP-N-acetylmuramyl pentapeptide phosphotransferase/UDP-N-acetylglucosamine-1-phosphate transferase [Ammoniphilus resinae]